MIEEIDHRMKTFKDNKRMTSDIRDIKSLPVIDFPQTIKSWKPKKKSKHSRPKAISTSKLNRIVKNKSHSNSVHSYYRKGKLHIIKSSKIVKTKIKGGKLIARKSIHKNGVGEKKKKKSKKNKTEQNEKNEVFEGLRLSLTSMNKETLTISAKFLEDNEEGTILLEQDFEIESKGTKTFDADYESLKQCVSVKVEIMAKVKESENEAKKHTLFIENVYEKEFPIMKIGVIQGMVNAKIVRV